MERRDELIAAFMGDESYLKLELIDERLQPIIDKIASLGFHCGFGSYNGTHFASFSEQKTNDKFLWFEEISNVKSTNRLLSVYAAIINFIKWHNSNSKMKQSDTKIEMEKFNTNSEIGSDHWFHTLMSRVIRMGEFINNHPEHENVKLYGNEIKEITQYVSKNLKSINTI